MYIIRTRQFLVALVFADLPSYPPLFQDFILVSILKCCETRAPGHTHIRAHARVHELSISTDRDSMRVQRVRPVQKAQCI